MKAGWAIQRPDGKVFPRIYPTRQVAIATFLPPYWKIAKEKGYRCVRVAPRIAIGPGGDSWQLNEWVFEETRGAENSYRSSWPGKKQ